MGVSLLGDVRVDGAPRLAPREQIVLSVLALRNGNVTSTGTLGDAIWGAAFPGTWRKQLQASVVVVRRAVGTDRVETFSDGYRLSIEDEDLDTARFENQLVRGRMHLESGQPGRAVSELRRALAIAPTDPLPALRHWSGATEEIARILALRHGAEDDLLRARLATGDHPTVAADAARAVAAEPLREARWWALALAQYRSGRQGDALETLRRVRALLAEELGADPGSELQSLERAILRQDPELLIVPKMQDSDDQCPYPGLVPFGISDAERFFGREADVAGTVERLTRDGFCIVSGPSGCGKSSLLRAGVAPIFLARGDTVTITTPARPLPELSDDGPQHLVVIDQFEEAFATGAPIASEAYCAGVARLVEQGHRVAIAVRSDLLDACARQPGLAPLIAWGLKILTTPTGSALMAAIEEPARQAGLTFEAGLVDLLVSDTESHPGGLPLLAHALAETWARREGSTMTLAAYRSAGGLSGSISRTAEQLYLSFSESDRQSCRLLLLRLVSIATGDSIVHRPLPLRALAGDSGLEGIVGRLAAARLLTVEADMVSLSHEAINRAWPRLHDWLESDRESQRVLEHLSRAAVGWYESGETDDELYRGARLAAARELDHRAPGNLTWSESQFLRASIEAAERGERERAERAEHNARQNVRLRRLLATIAGVLAIAIIAGIVAVGSAFEASRRSEESRAAQREAQLEALVGQSSALRTSARDVATLLAVEAYRRWPDDARARSALLGVFSTEPGFLGYQRIPAGLDRLVAAALPDGSGAVVLLGDGEVARYDFAKATMVDRLGATSDGPSLAGAIVRLSADGKRAVVAAPGGDAACGSADACTLISTFDLIERSRLLAPTAVAATGDGLTVDSNGEFAALTDSTTGSVATLDLSDGTVRALIDQPTTVTEDPPAKSVAFLPSGKLLIGSSDGGLRLFDPGTGNVESVISAPPGTVDARVVDAGGGLIVGSGHDGLVALDLTESRLVWSTRFTSSHPEPCPWLAASVTSGTAYCGDRFGRIEERSMTDGSLTGAHFDPQQGNVGDLTVTADGRTLLAIGVSEPVISRWRLDGSGPVAALIAEGQVGLDRYDHKGTRLVTATRIPGGRFDHDFTDFSIWSADADSRVRWMGELEGAGWLAPNLISGYVPADDAIGYFNASTGERLIGEEIPLDSISSWPAASGDRFHVMFPDGTIWTVATSTLKRIEPTMSVVGRPRSISTDTKGRVLVSSLTPDGRPWMTLLDGLTGKTLIDAVPGGEVSALAPDGTVFGSSARGQITQYDDQLRSIRTLPGARGEVNTLQVSNDGRVLMAGANDQTVSVYDTDTGIRLGTPLPADAPFIYPGFLRPDGMAVAVNDKAGIIVWDLDPVHQADQACSLAGRNLTRTEWQNHLRGLGEWRATCPQYE
jgi:DNA-binding SARP family transcriptional activator/WD40 repeat protein